MRVLAIADSDSYLKWGASLLATLPGDWERELIIVTTPVLPSASQRAAALAVSGIDPDCVAQLPLTDLPQRLDAVAADVVLVAARGPVARVLIRIAAETSPRPVIISGLPGISIPATRKALMFRVQADLFVLHSQREIREFRELSRANGWDHRFALATLPFVEHREDERADGTDLVFAAQAVVPRVRSDRFRVARLLRDAALADPSRRVVVKVRAVKGERQTHDERESYADLIAELGRIPDNLEFSSQPMNAALDTAEGLVTISSTAAIEAIARGIPIIALDTFGVSGRLINTVFMGSGTFGGEAAVIAREFRHPAPEWFADNYLHDPAGNTLVGETLALTAVRNAAGLPVRSAVRNRGGRLRLAWDRRRAFGEADRSLSGTIALIVGTPARALVLMGRRLRGLTARVPPHMLKP